MITEKDLQDAITECQGVKNPTANTCIKLAAFYTVKQHMFPHSKDGVNNEYSFDSKAKTDEIEKVDYFSETDFGRIVNGKNINDVLSVMDELMDAVQVFNPPLYASVLRKL